jgi:uncharacterized protein (DUF697 family)
VQIPIDIKAIIDEATNVDRARTTPLSVGLFLDETAPQDIQSFVREAFMSTSPHARVTLSSFPTYPVVVSGEPDIVVIVAGFDERIAGYATAFRECGVPVMVVTTMPDIVAAQASRSPGQLLACDLLSPDAPKPSRNLPERAAGASEPQVLTVEGAASLRRRMGEWVIETCTEKRLAFALAFPFIRKPLSLEAVKATSLQNAGVGFVLFIPGADMPVMTLNQAKMLLQIAAAYGQPMNAERAKELAVLVGGGFVCRSVARQAVAFVPALGWAVKAAIGYTGTFAMGQAVVEYFEGGGNIGGIAEVVHKAREKVTEAAMSAYKQPTVKTVVDNARTRAGNLVAGRPRKGRETR